MEVRISNTCSVTKSSSEFYSKQLMQCWRISLLSCLYFAGSIPWMSCTVQNLTIRSVTHELSPKRCVSNIVALINLWFIRNLSILLVSLISQNETILLKYPPRVWLSVFEAADLVDGRWGVVIKLKSFWSKGYCESGSSGKRAFLMWSLSVQKVSVAWNGSL